MISGRSIAADQRSLKEITVRCRDKFDIFRGFDDHGVLTGSSMYFEQAASLWLFVGAEVLQVLSLLQCTSHLRK